jgi:outer membrane protein assembly factor BamC
MSTWPSWLFSVGDNAIKESYQIIVRQISSNAAEVTFNDLSEQNKQETIDFGYELLSNIAKQLSSK